MFIKIIFIFCATLFAEGLGMTRVLYKKDGVTVEGHAKITPGLKGIAGGGAGITAKNSEGTSGGISLEYNPNSGKKIQGNFEMKPSQSSRLSIAGSVTPKEKSINFEYEQKFGAGSSRGDTAIRNYPKLTDPLSLNFYQSLHKSVNIPNVNPYKSTQFSANVPAYVTMQNRMPQIDFSSHFTKDYSNIGSVPSLPQSMPSVSRSTNIFSQTNSDPFKNTYPDLSVPAWRTITNRAPQFNNAPRYGMFGSSGFPSGGYAFG